MTNSSESQEGLLHAVLHVRESIGEIRGRLTAVERRQDRMEDRQIGTMTSTTPSPSSTAKQPSPAPSSPSSSLPAGLQKAEQAVSMAHTMVNAALEVWRFMLWAMPRYGSTAAIGAAIKKAVEVWFGM